MAIFEVGRVCVKLAGRDADQKCVVVDVIDDNFVMIDGLTRRRKCNVNHLEPLDEIVKIKKGADHKEIVGVFKKMGIELIDKKPKKAAEKPKKVRKVKVVVEETHGAKKVSSAQKSKTSSEAAPKTKKVEKKAEVKEEVKEVKPKTEKKAPAKKATTKPAKKD